MEMVIISDNFVTFLCYPIFGVFNFVYDVYCIACEVVQTPEHNCNSSSFQVNPVLARQLDDSSSEEKETIVRNILDKCHVQL